MERAETFLNRVEEKTSCQPDGRIGVEDLRKPRTLEERAFERYRWDTVREEPNSFAEETAILVATRLSHECHEMPFLRPNEVLERYYRIREQLRETPTEAHSRRLRPMAFHPTTVY